MPEGQNPLNILQTGRCCLLLSSDEVDVPRSFKRSGKVEACVYERGYRKRTDW